MIGRVPEAGKTDTGTFAGAMSLSKCEGMTSNTHIDLARSTDSSLIVIGEKAGYMCT